MNVSNLQVIAYCWHCKKEYDITRWSTKYGVKCNKPSCEGYVISPSGKVIMRIEGDLSQPYEPLMKEVVS